LQVTPSEYIFSRGNGRAASPLVCGAACSLASVSLAGCNRPKSELRSKCRRWVVSRGVLFSPAGVKPSTVFCECASSVAAACHHVQKQRPIMYEDPLFAVAASTFARHIFHRPPRRSPASARTCVVVDKHPQFRVSATNRLCLGHDTTHCVLNAAYSCRTKLRVTDNRPASARPKQREIAAGRSRATHLSEADAQEVLDCCADGTKLQLWLRAPRGASSSQRIALC
jgi:hypothetical protein